MKNCYFKNGSTKFKTISEAMTVRNEDGYDDVMVMVKCLSDNTINCIPYHEISELWEDEKLFLSLTRN